MRLQRMQRLKENEYLSSNWPDNLEHSNSCDQQAQGTFITSSSQQFLKRTTVKYARCDRFKPNQGAALPPGLVAV